MAMLTEHRK